MKRNNVGWRMVTGAVALALSWGAASMPVAHAKATSPAFRPTEKPLGNTYGTWLGKWAAWAFGGPSATNPLLALSNCDQWVQPDPARVWFLSANGPGTADVTCSVPTGLPIALTPGGVIDWQTPGDEAKLTEYMKTLPTSARKPTLKVDGVAVNANPYLVTSPVVKTRIVASEFGPKAGPDSGELSMQARGWMLVLKGLTAGKHTVVISDELAELDDQGNPVLVGGKQKWVVSRVNYTLNVGAGPAATGVAAASPAAPTSAAAGPTTLAVAPSTAAPTTVAAAQRVLMKDDFSNPASGWLDDNGGGWTMAYRGGSYSVAVDPGAGGHAGPGHQDQPDLRNSRVELDFEIMRGDGAFVLHCYDASPEGKNTTSTSVSQEPEFLYVGMSAKAGVGAMASVGGTRTTLQGLRPTPVSQAVKSMNRVAVECTGESGKPGNVKVWLNGMVVLDASVPVMPKGDGIRFGLEAFRGLTAPSEVVVDNLLVTSIP